MSYSPPPTPSTQSFYAGSPSVEISSISTSLSASISSSAVVGSTDGKRHVLRFPRFPHGEVLVLVFICFPRELARLCPSRPFGGAEIPPPSAGAGNAADLENAAARRVWGPRGF